MDPKKQKTGEKLLDIRTFSGTENDVPGRSTPRKKPKAFAELQTSSSLRIKEEKNCDPDVHSHNFIVKFSPSHQKEYSVNCFHPRTVLEAIKSIPEASKNIKHADENIIIQMGKGDKEIIIATHFPCSCVPEDEYLILTSKLERVEYVQEQNDKTVHPKDAYAVFCIDTVKGKNTSKKGLFRSKAIEKYKYLCVYGEKGITIEEALKRDGRFTGNLGNLELSDNDNPQIFTAHTQRIDNLHQKKFKICLLQNKRVSDEKAVVSILDVMKKSGRSVKTTMEQPGSSVNTEEIYERLRQQFPELKNWMESRFPGDSYQETLTLRKENFGKIQQSFCEVYRLKKLLKMGKSVCKVLVENVCQGTGFVLFDNFILTSAHLFKDCTEGKYLKPHIRVLVFFNYDDPEPNMNYFYFTVEKAIVDEDHELDYAILELRPDGQKANQNCQAESIQVPPGLLKKFGPVPENGEACLIGHPSGQVKKIDPTCIIEPEKKDQIVKDHMAQYQGKMVTVNSALSKPNNGDIENIMMSEPMNTNKPFYHTFMYHGASGAPLFDAHVNLIGLHTAGYLYPKGNPIIEFAQPLLCIFERFVMNLKKSGNETLLKRVEKTAKTNQYLKRILKTEPMEVD